MNDKTASITAAAILQKGRKQPEAREVKALGGQVVYIKHMTARERYTWELGALNDGGIVEKSLLPDSSLNLVATCIVDENGKQLLTLAEVGGLDADLVSELREYCQEVNGLKAKATNEAGKS